LLPIPVGVARKIARLQEIFSGMGLTIGVKWLLLIKWELAEKPKQLGGLDVVLGPWLTRREPEDLEANT